MYSIVPISAVGTGLSVIVPLYILALHGSVLDVGFAVTLYNIVAIPSSLLWGKLTDRFGGKRHRLFVMSSIISIFPVLLIVELAYGPHIVEAAYGLYALVATAASPSINILVMGTKRSPSLPRFFSRYSIYSIVGSLLAMIPGLLIGRQIVVYLDILLAVNLAGLLLAWFTIKELKPSSVPKSKARRARMLFPVFNMLSALPNLLTSQKLIEDLHKVFDIRHRNLYVLLLAIAMLNGAMNLFNTSYIPYLESFGLSYGSIFGINIVNTIAQLSVYVALAYLVLRKMNLHRYYGVSVIARGFSYIFMSLPLLAAVGAFFYINLAGYAIAGIAYAMWNITSSVLLFDHIRGRNAGYNIGIWLAVLGFSAVAGSLASGIISHEIGYAYTFISASAITFISLMVFGVYHKNSYAGPS
ncbi:MAG: MFS transporter [Candidatus Marsarchaeota archaeon]|nr:MFS transporter [Candidatus Marsarchaeota archaeon]